MLGRSSLRLRVQCFTIITGYGNNSGGKDVVKGAVLAVGCWPAQTVWGWGAAGGAGGGTGSGG